MPAMVVNDDACCLDERGVWTFIAGKPAPTGILVDMTLVFTADDPDELQAGYQAASLCF
ncbi:hypothetical protein J2Y86_001040 [Pseudomonas migulae]|uniref:hypothetical protein n=1 Tax=Pseudomonas migulae TaxID=78543 RepID=UPI00209FA324|nr:hypothetical protein [Pseudomonas migulae]MCP1496333.1 hypothetical protein [Pseudomonas migulae]